MQALRTLLLLAALALLAPATYSDDASSTIPPGLTNYVQRPEAAFSWKLVEKKEVAGAKTYLIKLVSQTWQNIPWDHDLLVVLPAGAKPSSTMLLYNQGNNVSDRTRMTAALLANKLKAPVAFLFGIPKQPLFEGKKEDALIAETYVRYLETKDESWPLLFPMVKSLIKAMDALQAFTKEEWQTEVKDFVITGGSKRGWTSWLTAATGDKRVKAIAPMVIDTLNMMVQMPHQMEMFGGKYSEQIADYTARGLVPLPDTTDARRLWAMVDPWVYRERLTMPKLIINGANDPYWTVDALNYYWDDLKGPKWVIIVPNAGHDLREVGAGGQKEPLPSRAFNTLIAYTRHQVNGTTMPQVTWKHDDADGKLRLTVHAGPAAKKARVWVASHPTTDFRPARWKSEDGALGKDGTVVFQVEKPKEGYQAFYAEVDYALDDLPYSLSTQVRVANGK